jgi:hypothetical protein
MKSNLIALITLMFSYGAFAGSFLVPGNLSPFEVLNTEGNLKSYSTFLNKLPTKIKKLRMSSIETKNTIEGVTSIEGTLKMGIVAIGGETTGIAIMTEDGLVEVDFSNYEGLIKLSNLDGKRVELYGDSEMRYSIERGFRKVFIINGLLELE